MPGKDSKYSQEYSERSFWQKVKKFALAAGKEVIEKALTLYFALRDPDTPVWAKGVITSALGYFILPLDAIPDIIPAVGFADDLGAVATALAVVGTHLKPEHVRKAKVQLRLLFKGDSAKK